LRPFIIIWESTFACDPACKHCRANSEIFRSPEEPQEEAKELLDQIKGFGFSPPIFIITGGDPFKRDDIFSIAEYGKLIGIPVSFSPSVTPLFTDDKIELMKKAGVKAVSLSLDGPDERTHDEFRGSLIISSLITFKTLSFSGGISFVAVTHTIFSSTPKYS